MIIIHKPTFSKQLKQIIEYITQDKPSASMKFKNELKESIDLKINFYIHNFHGYYKLILKLYHN